MRVVINEAQINRNRKISHLLFFISLGGMILGFFFTWTADPTSGVSQLSCFFLPILLLLTLTSVRMANVWIREPRPVDVLNSSLKGLGPKYTIFHHLLPAPHVLIGPEGVFTLTVVWQDKAYRVKGKKWYGDEGFLRKLNGYLRQDLIGNPFNDATLHAQQVQRLINKIAPDAEIAVQPLVVFIHPNASFEQEDPLYPVLYADSKKKPSLRQYLRELPANPANTLRPEHLDAIDRMYGLMTRQEIAEFTGETFDLAGDDFAPDQDDEGAESEDMLEAQGTRGTVFLAQRGQMYYFGATTGSVEKSLSALEADGKEAVELVHAFETADAFAVRDALQHKYDRKRQKENWFGLSKKDVAWIKARRGS
ncbi:MAG: NERD domain-containing protein [Anaerolineae bacterium]|nr:NERD domain-containing protein [Anaerolineae bacterium]